MLARMFSDLLDLYTLGTVVPSNIPYCEDQLCLQTLPWCSLLLSSCGRSHLPTRPEVGTGFPVLELLVIVNFLAWLLGTVFGSSASS